MDYYYIFTFILIFGITTKRTVADDCMYNLCAWKFQQWSTHVQCLGTNGRGLVRDVDCEDGNTIHICCRLPYRDDIQKSRQNFFRSVLWTGDVISHSCTLRVLCEQSCIDGLDGLGRSSYPEVLSDDSPQRKQYVEAWKAGERSSCFNQTKNNVPYDELTCANSCQNKYQDCDKDLQESYKAKALVISARTVHKMGMWFFSYYWLSRDYISLGEKYSVEVIQAVKKGLEDVHNRVVNMKNAFKVYKEKHSQKEQRRKRSANEKYENTEKWNEFLTFYNNSDPELVDVVFETLDYERFDTIVHVANETLITYDFGEGEWIESGSERTFTLISLIMLSIASIFVW